MAPSGEGFGGAPVAQALVGKAVGPGPPRFPTWLVCEKEMIQYGANVPLAGALSAATEVLGRTISAVHGIWALLTHSGGL